MNYIYVIFAILNQYRRCRVTMHFIICLLLLFFYQYIYSFASTYGLLAYYAYIRY
jgi:hypothetical protein